MKKAFSLVELSIVLVILGLLVGGILAGQSLIRASELRSVSTEYQRYQIAVQAFRDKYFYAPGDMLNATSFWGALSTVNDATCQALPATSGTATCNGNGNKQINPIYVVTGDEQQRTWQHLANAGLIEGQYTGVWPISTTANPVSKVGSASSWRLFYLGNYAGNTQMFAGDLGNLLQLYNITITPGESWNIDTKMDDGMPALGSVIGSKGTTALPCTDRANQAVSATLDPAAVYNLSSNDKVCNNIIFRRAI